MVYKIKMKRQKILKLKEICPAGKNGRDKPGRAFSTNESVY
jgi:hypothetical protein